MRVKPNFDIKKWCVYNESAFKLELKPNAPPEIKEKFEEWNRQYENNRLLEESIEELK